MGVQHQLQLLQLPSSLSSSLLLLGFQRETERPVEAAGFEAHPETRLQRVQQKQRSEVAAWTGLAQRRTSLLVEMLETNRRLLLH